MDKGRKSKGGVDGGRKRKGGAEGGKKKVRVWMEGGREKEEWMEGRRRLEQEEAGGIDRRAATERRGSHAPHSPPPPSKSLPHLTRSFLSSPSPLLPSLAPSLVPSLAPNIALSYALARPLRSTTLPPPPLPRSVPSRYRSIRTIRSSRVSPGILGPPYTVVPFA